MASARWEHRAFRLCIHSSVAQIKIFVQGRISGTIADRKLKKRFLTYSGENNVSGLFTFEWSVLIAEKTTFDLGTLDSGERLLPFGLLVLMKCWDLLHAMNCSMDTSRTIEDVTFIQLKSKCMYWNYTTFLDIIWTLLVLTGYPCFDREAPRSSRNTWEAE